MLSKLSRAGAGPRTRLILLASFSALLIRSYLLFEWTHHLMTTWCNSFDACHSIIETWCVESRCSCSSLAILLVHAQSTSWIRAFMESDRAALVRLHTNAEHVTDHGRHLCLFFFNQILFKAERIAKFLNSIHVLILPFAHRSELFFNHFVYLAEIAAGNQWCCVLEASWLFSRGVNLRRYEVLFYLRFFLGNCIFQVT